MYHSAQTICVYSCVFYGYGRGVVIHVISVFIVSVWHVYTHVLTCLSLACGCLWWLCVVMDMHSQDYIQSALVSAGSMAEASTVLGLLSHSEMECAREDSYATCRNHLILDKGLQHPCIV